MRLSRAGRKDMVRVVMFQYDRRHPNGCLTTGDLAHRTGIKSSSKFKKLLFEMVKEGDLKAVKFQPKFDCGYTVDGWQFARVKQLPLPDRTITINGKEGSWLDERFAAWVK